MELNKKQKEIVNSNYNTTIVIASAASGKTLVLTERVKKLLEDGVEPEKIVVITFTNAAAEEMRQRIGEKANKCFIGTIHSYANYILLCNGFSTSQYIQEGQFDKFFDLIETENINYKPNIKHLLLDEAQDTDTKQWNFILDFIQPKNLFIVGDYRQELYHWRGSDVKTFRNLYLRKDSKVFELNENYRNGQNILNYAAGIMLNDYVPYDYMDNSICCSNREGQVYRSNLDYTWMVKTIKSHDNYKDWFILTRDNRQLDMIKRELEKRDIPCVSFRQGDLNKQELSDVMNSNTVKVLTIHSSKGLEAKNVMVYGMRFNSKDEVCCSYVAATRAMDRLYILKAKKQNVQQAKIINWE